MSTEQDRYLLSWEEVALIYNHRENDTLHPNTVKQIGLVAMRTLREDGWRKVRLGQTTIEEVLKYT